MKTKQDFNKEGKRLGRIANQRQALKDAEPYQGTVYFWDMAFLALQQNAISRILEKGLDPEVFGLEY